MAAQNIYRETLTALFLVACCVAPAWAADVVLAGIVLDAGTGQPLDKVNVKDSGNVQNFDTTSKEEGLLYVTRASVTGGKAVLTYQCEGYRTRRNEVPVGKSEYVKVKPFKLEKMPDRHASSATLRSTYGEASTLLKYGLDSDLPVLVVAVLGDLDALKATIDERIAQPAIGLAEKLELGELSALAGKTAGLQELRLTYVHSMGLESSELARRAALFRTLLDQRIGQLDDRKKSLAVKLMEAPNPEKPKLTANYNEALKLIQAAGRLRTEVPF